MSALTPAQASLALGGTASAIAGGYGVTYLVSDNETDNKIKDKSKEQQPILNPEPEQVEKFEGDTLPSGYDNQKLISLFKQESFNKLVQPTEQNKIWFEWSLKERYGKRATATLHSTFANVTVGVEDTTTPGVSTPKSLRKACEDAYKSDSTAYTFTNSNLLQNIFDFCSVKAVYTEFNNFIEPKVGTGYTAATDTFANGVLKEKANRTHLVKTTENKYWWVWAYEKLVKPVDKTKRSSAFNTVDKDYKENATDQTYLNKACEEAYKKNKQDLSENSPLTILEDIKRFCTKGIDKQEIVLPTETAAPTPEAKTEPQDSVTVFDGTNLGSGYEGQLLSVLKKGNRDKFVKAIGDTAGTKTKEWWEWSYTERFDKRVKTEDNNKLDALFQSVESAHADNAETQEPNKQKALNQACDKAYQKAKDDYVPGGNLLKNIVDYCAKKHNTTGVDLTEPEVTTWKEDTGLENNEAYKGRLLTADNNKNHLVKDVADNKYWFKWTYEKLVKDNEKANYVAPFANVADYGDSGTTPINKACDAAYKKVKNHIVNGLLDKVKELCSSTKTLPIHPEEPAEHADKTNVISAHDVYTFAFVVHNKAKLMDPSKGQEWWKWSYENRFPIVEAEKEKLPVWFESVSKGYEAITSVESIAEKPTALNHACSLSYKKRKSELDAEAKKGKTKTLIKVIEDLCATKGSTLQSQEAKFFSLKKEGSPLPDYTPTNYEQGTAKEDNNKDKLSETRHAVAEEWWIKKFSSISNYSETNTFFKEVDKGWVKGDESGSPKGLNNACHLAYSHKKTESDYAAVKELIKKYCTKEGVGDLEDATDQS